MRRAFVFLSALLATGAFDSGLSRAGEATSLARLERDFLELPPSARRLTGPLFWLHGDESPERLRATLRKVAEGGNGCFTAESRPHRDWLGEGWYRDLGVCLRAAEELDLQMWIFDEKWWPSGEVGGKVPPRHGSKRLVMEATDVTGPASFDAKGHGGPRYLATLAGRVAAGGIDGASLVDLTPSARDGRIRWKVPPGRWKVMRLGWEPAGGRRILVDGASREAVEWYLRTVYQPHYDRFGAEFGKRIRGYFYDEPETPGDWGTELRGVLEERGVDWKKAFVGWKARLAGEEQVAARYQYAHALAEAWGRTLYGGIAEWCHRHRVRSIGHFLEHGREYAHPRLCAGNMFQLQKYSDMGGIDAVFRQFVPAKRDPGLWQTPKLGSSISHAYGKRDDLAMVEIFGARGQDLGYCEMKWWADHMYASGINFLIPHSFNPRAPRDSDCPPYFWDGGREPRWPLFRVWADWTCRLSTLLTGGRHVAPVAFLFAGQSERVGRIIPPEPMSTALQDALYDSDWLPWEVFERDVEISGRELALRAERYRVLVVPPVEVIPYESLRKAREFLEAGGVVVGYGFLPRLSATLGRDSRDIAELSGAIWGGRKPGLSVCRTSAAGGRSYLLPEKPTPEMLQAVLAGDAGVHATLEVLEGETDHWLHVLHRRKAGADLFFIANQLVSGEARVFKLRVRAPGTPECWDPMRGEITSVPFARKGESVELSLELWPLESLLLVFRPDAPRRPARVDSLAGERAAALATLAVAGGPVAPPAPPAAVPEGGRGGRREGGRWVWYPEGKPEVAAPPGTRFFRRRIELPAGRKIRAARFYGTADNEFRLFVDGEEAGGGDSSSEGWRSPVALDLTGRLRTDGAHQLAIAAKNASDQPNPAGLIGRLVVELERGEPWSVAVDASWRAAKEEAPGWTGAGFDDSAWPAARELGPFGRGPWGRLGTRLTLGPVAAHPWAGRCEIPAGSVWLQRETRVHLELEGIAPEEAARITVNGRHAGGFIGRPLRLDVTRWLREGENTFRVEPFAPRQARLVARRG